MISTGLYAPETLESKEQAEARVAEEAAAAENETTAGS